ncbi:MAG: LysR family transcriptional regulator [Pseudomonadales bacterium]
MNTTALHTFLSIVETGSLVRASEKMNVTQSTVTARLKSLEQELGQTLLNRYKSGTTLTPAGTKLLRYAKIMTGLWQQAQHEAGLPAGTEAVCNFGCHNDLWYGVGKQFFDRIANEHEEIAVSVLHGSQQELEGWLVDGMVDVILSYQPFAPGSQTVYELPGEKIVLYSDRPNSPIKFDPYYIYVDHGEEYRRLHAEYYHDAGTARMNFDSPRWALDFLLERGGSAYLPEPLAESYVQQGKLHRLDSAPSFSRKRYLLANDIVTANWEWFHSMVADLQQATA